MLDNTDIDSSPWQSREGIRYFERTDPPQRTVSPEKKTLRRFTQYHVMSWIFGVAPPAGRAFPIFSLTLPTVTAFAIVHILLRVEDVPIRAYPKDQSFCPLDISFILPAP